MPFKENDVMNDMVNHPDHYISEHGMEVIDVIKEFTQGLMGIEATDTGNIIKYILRWKHKNGLEDLKKAQWYLNHLINEVENESEAFKEDECTRIFSPRTFTFTCNLESSPNKEDDGK